VIFKEGWAISSGG